jgi:hypothetical protein
MIEILKGTNMKKLFLSIFGLAALAGCSSHYDYYKGRVRYTQDGADCIYYARERGRKFSDEIRGMDQGKKIVYSNTLCASLFEKDTAGQRVRQKDQILTPAATETPRSSCGCRIGCAQKASVMKRSYVIVSGM